jgi:hypothetical protein
MIAVKLLIADTRRKKQHLKLYKMNHNRRIALTRLSSILGKALKICEVYNKDYKSGRR